MARYLDEEGLKTLWRNISEKFVDNNELNAGVDTGVNNGLAKIGLKYDKDAKTVNITVDGSDSSSIDVTDFIKDGMLNDVAIKTVVDVVSDETLEVAQSVVVNYINDVVVGDKVIEFVWNTDASEGSIKVDYLKTSDIGVTPETSNTKLSESITVAGGPLADLWLAAGLESTIDPSKYTDIQSLLTALFCVEKWSKSITKSNGNPSTSVSTTLTLSKSNNSVVKYGTGVSISTLSATQKTTSTTATISGFEYGYATSNDKSSIVNSASISRSWTYAGDGAATAEITGYTGFGLSSIPSKSDVLTVGIGTNSITATSTGVAKTATCEQVGPVYDVSNLQSISDVAQQINSQSKDLLAPISSATQTIYGVYPIYTNYSSNGNLGDITTEIVATNKDQTVFEITYANDSTNSCKFAWPGDRTIKVQLWNPTFGIYGDVDAANQSIVEISKVINNVTYKSWTYTGNSLGEGAKFKFTLNKKISE